MPPTSDLAYSHVRDFQRHSSWKDGTQLILHSIALGFALEILHIQFLRCDPFLHFACFDVRVTDFDDLARKVLECLRCSGTRLALEM